MNEQKQCSKCDVLKPLDGFRKGRNQCKECKRESDREHYHRPEVRKRKRKYSHEYYKRLKTIEALYMELTRVNNA